MRAAPLDGWTSWTVVRFERHGLGYRYGMPLGTSIFLIAVGAILRYAVTASTSGINLATVGLILIIVGIVGVLLSLFYMTLWSPRRRERVIERDPYQEPPPRAY